MSCSSAFVISQCIKSIQNLLSQTYPERDNDISHELAIIKVELDKELAIRIHAQKEGLYSLLIECLKEMHSKHLLQVLQTLTSLTNGYPDLLDKTGSDFMIGFLQPNITLDLIIQNLKWIKNCVTSHEKNRSDLIQREIQNCFRNLLQIFNDKPRLIIQICQVIKKLISDDDIRVVHGNSHEHARALANETLCGLISFLNVYEDDLSVLAEVIPTISALLVRDEYCLKFYERNGLRYVMNAMMKFPDNEMICRNCILLIKALAGCDCVKEPVVENGAAPLIIAAMYRHKISSKLVAAGCACISALALRSPSNAQSLVLAGSPELLITVLNLHRDNLTVLKNGFWAIRNIVARSFEHRARFTALDTHILVYECRKKFPVELNYEARITLRDLGCDIEDEYPWPRK